LQQGIKVAEGVAVPSEKSELVKKKTFFSSEK
jgi:hypothetical protein